MKINFKRKKQKNQNKQKNKNSTKFHKIQLQSIRFKVIALFSAAILFVSLVIGLLGLSISRRIVAQEAEKGMMALAEQSAKLTQDRIENLTAILKTLADASELSRMGLRSSEQMESLKKVLEYTDFEMLGVLNVAAHSSSILYADGTVENVGESEFLNRAAEGETVVSDLVIHSGTGEPVVMFATPITEGENIVGVLVGRMNGIVLSEITSDITYGATGHAYMVNQNGIIVAHQDRDLVSGRWNPADELRRIETSQAGEGVDSVSSSTAEGGAFKREELESISAAFDEMLEKKTGLSSFLMDGKEYMQAYTEVEGTNWILAVTAEKSDVLASLPGLTNSLVITGLAVLAAGIILSFFIGSSFANPIENLTRILGRVADYDLTVDENSPVFKYMKRRDEVGKIAGALMKALESFTDLLKQALASSEMVGATAEELSASVQEISSNTQNQASNSEELSSSMEEMAASINEVSSNMQAAAADVRHISRNMSDIEGLVNTNEGNLHRIEQSLSAILESLDEARKSINTISDRSQVASREAEVTVTLADEGKQNLDKTVTQMETIQDTIDNLAEVMNGLGESATQIGDITDMIKDVAEQTNLLALNASIEAARAGEHGKGFAVVAQAIGSLAEESQNATKEIAKVIRNIQAEIAKAVQRSEEGTRVVESGTELVKTTSGSLEKIFEAIQLTSEIIHEITDLMNTQAQDINRVYESADDINNKVSDLMKAMKEETESTADINQKLASLSKVIDEISEAMNQQSAAAEQVTHAVNENAAGIEEISLSSEEIARSADDLARSAQELVQQVQRFKI